MKKTLFLAIINGLGVYQGEEKNLRNKARTKNIENYTKRYPVVALKDNKALGCVSQHISDSKIGHTILSAGRPYYPTPKQIDKDISSGDFFNNKVLQQAVGWSKDRDSQFHLVGSLPSQNSNSKLEHLLSLIELAERQDLKDQIVLHLFIDKNEKEYFENLLDKINESCIATISRKDCALNQAGDYKKIKKAHRAIFSADGKSLSKPQQVFDEEDKVFVKSDYTGLREGDSVLFFNYDPEDIRRLTKSMSLPVFNKFDREHIQDILFTALVEYEKNISTKVAYSNQIFHNCLTEIIEKQNRHQFHISETSKYPHISYYLNGKIPDSFDEEKRKIVDSPKIENFSDQPEMSIKKLTDSIINAIHSEENDIIIADFSNFEQVNSDLRSKLEALEIIDKNLGKIIDHLLVKEGTCVITSDYNQSISKESENTNLVPFIVVDEDKAGLSAPAGDPPEGNLSLVEPAGSLLDVAPTILKMLDIKKPPEMVGKDLLT